MTTLFVILSGLLVTVDAANPLDGQNATVELHTISSLLANTPEHRLEIGTLSWMLLNSSDSSFAGS